MRKQVAGQGDAAEPEGRKENRSSLHDVSSCRLATVTEGADGTIEIASWRSRLRRWRYPKLGARIYG